MVAMRNNVRRIREAKGFTLEQVAQRVNATRAQISKVERGIIRLNDVWMERLSMALTCSVHDLIDDEIPTNHANESAYGNRHLEVIAPVIGTVDAQQVGLIKSLPGNERYQIRVGRTESDSFSEFFGLIVRPGPYQDFPVGTEMIFARLNPGDEGKIKPGACVVCTYKDEFGNTTDEFLRTIEYDNYGLPYASFKLNTGKTAATTLTSTLLIGTQSPYALLELTQKADRYPPPKKPELRPVPLNNQTLDITAVLVRTVRPELF